MILGMCVGVLDEKIGPTSVYSIDLDDDLSKKLTMKIMVGVMSFSSESDDTNLRGESIIPFIKEKIITFAYLFPIKDTKARGGYRQCSIIVAFDIHDRKLLYENATNLTRILKSMSGMVELKHLQGTNFPFSISEQYDLLRNAIYTESQQTAPKGKTTLTIICPRCAIKKEIELPSVAKGVKFIEHEIYEKEVCDHAFTVYLDSKFNILGYKEPEIELTDMKNMFSKLKSPYD